MSDYTFVITSKYVSVEHLTPDLTNTQTEGYSRDLSLINIPCNIQPSTPEVIALYGGAMGKVYTMFTTASGVLESDRLTVSGTGQQFIVKGKQYYDYGTLQYGDYVLEEKQE